MLSLVQCKCKGRRYKVRLYRLLPYLLPLQVKTFPYPPLPSVTLPYLGLPSLTPPALPSSSLPSPHKVSAEEVRRFAADAEELRGSLEAGSGCFFVTRHFLIHLLSYWSTDLLTK